MIVVELPSFSDHNVSQLIEYLVGEMSWEGRPVVGYRIEVIGSVFAEVSRDIVGYCVLDALFRVNKGIWQEEVKNVDVMPLKNKFYFLYYQKNAYRYSSRKKIVEELVNFVNKRALFA